ncbi:MAG: DUF4405 domain-containing protein [Pseudomonadota bacterium]
MKTKGFQTRGFVSLLTAAGFIVMTVSGLVAYVVPHGRIAYWTDWSFLGLTKENWGNMHIAASILFVSAGCFHIYLNWKPLMRYIAGTAQEGLKLKRELFLTLALTAFVLFSAIFRVPPLSYLLDLSDFAKESWVSREYEPPFGRAELLGLDSFCRKMDIPVEKAVDALRAKGISVRDVNEPLQDMARRNKLSALKLYMAIKHLEEKHAPAVADRSLTPRMVEDQFSGSGVGRKTMGEVAASLKLDVATMKQRLAAVKIGVRDDEPIKQAAERTGLQPIELLKVMLIDGYKPQR